ncbi:MAG: hypothetical protein HY788_11635 [Deltaproteobacteria bacterium]|nr:hypothetical protein [Deltaproteobacteria bacterium]
MVMGSRSKLIAVCLTLLVLAACSPEAPVDIEEITAAPKTYAGSDRCKMCHLQHYDSWKMTSHSRSTLDVQKDASAIMVPYSEAKIRESFTQSEDAAKPSTDQIYIPKLDEIKYAIGGQWQQRFIVEKNGALYIAPIQYNMDTHRWVTYREGDWDQKPWLQYCGGCHATGVDLKNNRFSELSIGCEACHGKGSWHVALPKTAVFEKRKTIVNPAKLSTGARVQICGSCHERGMSTVAEGVHWPVDYQPGEALAAYYNATSYAEGDTGNFYMNEFSKGHHQQYNDWLKSAHYVEGVTCTSCHFVHQIGLPPTKSQTSAAGSQQCFQCHQLVNRVKAHAIHTFANCVGCHMPRIAKNAESGDLHSHVFVTLLPIDTIKNPNIPNSCETCHKHKGADLKKLQRDAFGGFGGGESESAGSPEGEGKDPEIQLKEEGAETFELK